MAELTKEQIIENNKIIAEFMGGKIISANSSPGTIKEFYYFEEVSKKEITHNYGDFTLYTGSFSSTPFVHLIDNLKYHKDWNWIMPVVGKIEEEMGGFINIRAGRISIAWIDFSDEEDNPLTIEGAYDKTVKFEKQTGEDTKLLKLYSLIVEFIVWYNKNKINYD